MTIDKLYLKIKYGENDGSEEFYRQFTYKELDTLVRYLFVLTPSYELYGSDQTEDSKISTLIYWLSTWTHTSKRRHRNDRSRVNKAISMLQDDYNR